MRSFLFITQLLCLFVLVHSGEAQVSERNGTIKVVTPTFTTIDVPGALQTGIAAINSLGTMTGFYALTTASQYFHSFSLDGGDFAFFDYPGASSTEATGINDSGLIVGFEGDFLDNGFTFDGTSFTTLTDGSNTRTFVWGINNAGDMAGGAGSPYTTEAFVLHGGQFIPLNFPGSYTYAYATGVNNLLQVVGWADTHSYLYANGKFKNIDFPGANLTAAFSINDKGIIVGYYQMNAIVIAFAWKKGKFLSFSYPGAVETFAYGISQGGQIVGTYTLDYNTWHGFVTNPITEADFQ